MCQVFGSLPRVYGKIKEETPAARVLSPLHLFYYYKWWWWWWGRWFQEHWHFFPPHKMGEERNKVEWWWASDERGACKHYVVRCGLKWIILYPLCNLACNRETEAQNDFTPHTQICGFFVDNIHISNKKIYTCTYIHRSYLSIYLSIYVYINMKRVHKLWNLSSHYITLPQFGWLKPEAP